LLTEGLKKRQELWAFPPELVIFQHSNWNNSKYSNTFWNCFETTHYIEKLISAYIN